MSDGLLRRLRDAGRGFVGTDASATLAAVTIELPRPKPTLQDLLNRPGVSASLSAIIGALRWGAVMIGLVFAVPRAAGGDRQIVATVAIAIFLTSMRTIYPLKLGDRSMPSVINALSDVAILSAALGLREGFGNPLVGAVLVAVAIAAFGWGLRIGGLAGIVSLAVTSGVHFFLGDTFAPPSALAITGLAAAVMVPGVALDRLLESESDRRELVDERDRLTETNQLLGVLNDLTRSLQSSLDQADVIQATRRELIDTFDATRLALLSFEDGTYSTLVQDSFGLAPSLTEPELPPVLRKAARSADPLWIQDLSTVPGYDRTGSGLYIRLIVRNQDTGLLAVEHPDPSRYTALDRDLLTQMSDVLALTLDNARVFNQLRSLAAAEERSKIARDLHDRLGQYLTYIALELERIHSDVPSNDLKSLHEEVQGAVTEFRDTLLELRAAVSADRPLSMVLDEVVSRFIKRSQIDVSLTIDDRSARLPARVENELLRICQEALTNVQKHAGAAKVHIRWSVADGRGVLVIADNGRGFEPTTGIRANAYGLVGMRERAAAVGALLTITSEPGQGTAITVQTSQHPNR